MTLRHKQDTHNNFWNPVIHGDEASLFFTVLLPCLLCEAIVKVVGDVSTCRNKARSDRDMHTEMNSVRINSGELSTCRNKAHRDKDRHRDELC